LYAAADQRTKDAQDREAAGIVLNALVRPIMPSTGLDIYDAYKRGEINNVTDALAAPYLTNSWSMRNPGRALATDIIAPFALSKGTQLVKFASNDIADSWKLMRYQLAHPESQVYGIADDSFINFLQRQTGKNIKRVHIKDTKLGNIYSDGFSFVDDSGKEIAHIAGTKKGGSVYVESTNVVPEYRTKGLGRQMYYDFNENVFNQYGTTLRSFPGQHQMTLTDASGRRTSPSSNFWRSLTNDGLATFERNGIMGDYVMKEPSVVSQIHIPGINRTISKRDALEQAGNQQFWNGLLDEIQTIPNGEAKWQASQILDRIRRTIKNEASIIKFKEEVGKTVGITDANGMTTYLAGRPVKFKTNVEGIERFEGSSKIPAPSRPNTYIDEPRYTQYNEVTGKMEPIPRASIDDIPNLRNTLNNIIKNIKDDDIIPQFLDGSYISAFKHEAAQQGINLGNLSNRDIAKVLTEQYRQLQNSSSGVLKDNVFWRTWGKSLPAKEFNWQAHVGESTGNLGFWGKGNYFATGNFQGSAVNRPYMIKGIRQLGYDDLLGVSGADEAFKTRDILDKLSIDGARPGLEDIGTRWMAEMPSTRAIVATPHGLQNSYGVLDTGERGIELVTQKNTGIKSLIPDFRIGNGVTFLRDWNNPNVYRSIIPLGLGYGVYKNQ
jgi:hypothetical protein